MQVRCPQCQETFQAKGNARRIKCPSCGTREEAPEAGFAAAWAAGKPRTQFQPLGRPSSATAGSSSASPAVIWTVVAVVALLAIGAFWYFSQQPAATPGGGNATGGEGTCAGATTVGLELTNPGDSVAAIDTDKGCILVELYDAGAPITTANFKRYANERLFDGTLFHRIDKDFMIQGGGMDTNGVFRTAPYPAIKNEAKTSPLVNAKYTIAMARQGAADSATNQFFINDAANCFLDASTRSSCPGQVSSPDGYAAFGRVVQGTDVVDTIANTPVAPMKEGSHCQDDNCPVQDVVIRTIRILGGGAVGSATTPPSSTSSAPAATLPASATCPDATLMPRALGGPVETDFITPGVWNVCSTSESNYVWVHNNGTSELAYTFSITGPGGAALPAGWSVSFATPSGTLPGQEPGAHNAASWAATIVSLTVPAAQVAGEVPAELRIGSAVRPFTFHVRTLGETVTKSGDSVTTCYDLRGEDGRVISKSAFPLTIGAPGAVDGYRYGTTGMAPQETVTLVVPPPFAYGQAGRQGVNPWETLTWAAYNNTAGATCPSG